MQLHDVELLADQMAQLQLLEQRRSDREMGMPNALLVLTFKDLMIDILQMQPNQLYSGTLKRRFIALFGVLPEVIAKVWELLEEWEILEQLQGGFKKVHLCWAFIYMKVYANETAMRQMVGGNPDEKTLRKWIWEFLEAISELEPHLIKWENRKKNDKFYDCMASIDGTDYVIPQVKVKNPTKPGKKMINKALYSPKKNGPAVRYEVAVAILTNEIVHIAGPFCAGDWNDVMIFRASLMHKLEPGERVEADAGYVAELLKVKTQGFADEEKDLIRKSIEGRHEIVNGYLKHFNCLSQKFKAPKGDIFALLEKHSTIFRAVAVVTQICMKLGYKELFKIDEERYADS